MPSAVTSGMETTCARVFNLLAQVETSFLGTRVRLCWRDYVFNVIY